MRYQPLPTTFFQSQPRKGSGSVRRLFIFAATTSLLLMSAACSKDKGDKEPTVSVQVAPVEKTTIQHVIKSQAILFPKQQAAIVSKITAPAQKFLIKRATPEAKEQRLPVPKHRE